jgi:ribonuclease HI
MIEGYFDGLCEPNPGGVATYGFVVKRGGKKVHEGHGLACAPRTPQCTNNVAEYTGLLKLLEHLVDGNLAEPAVIRGDSDLVIRQVKGEYKVKSALLAPLYAKVRDLVARLPSVKFQHIPREENRDADALTNLAYAEYKGERLPAPTTDVMTVDLVFAAPRDVVSDAFRKANLKGQCTAVPGGTRVQVDLPLNPESLRPLLALKARLES